MCDHLKYFHHVHVHQSQHMLYRLVLFWLTIGAQTSY